MTVPRSDHAIIITGHQVNKTASCGQCVTHDPEDSEASAHAGRIGKLEGDDQIRMWGRLHCGLGLVVKAPDHGVPCGEGSSRHGSGGFESMSCSPMSSVNSGRLAWLETLHSCSSPLTNACTSRSRMVWLNSFKPRRVSGFSLRHFGVHPSMSGTSYCSGFSSPSYHSRSMSTRSSASS